MKRADLEEAMLARRFVTVKRRRDWEDFSGFIVGVGHEWVALLDVPLASFEGFVFLRRKDIRKLSRGRHPKRAKAAVAYEGSWPPALPDAIDLHDVRSLLFTAGALSRTLGFANERLMPGIWVGTVDRITKKVLENREVTPSGRWGDHMLFDLDRITKVVLWDPYVERITALADAH